MHARDSSKGMRIWPLSSSNPEAQPSVICDETVQNEPDVEYHVDSEEECLRNRRKRKRDGDGDASNRKRHGNRATPVQVPVEHRPQTMDDGDLPNLIASVMDLLDGEDDAGVDRAAGRGPITRSRASKQPREPTTPQRHNTPAVPTMETFDDRAEYPVEALLAKAKIGRRVYYKVKWEGYGASQSSWVKMRDIGEEAIEAFKMGGQRGVFTFDKIIAAPEGATNNASYLIQLKLGHLTDTAEVDASDLSAAEIAKFRLQNASEVL